MPRSVISTAAEFRPGAWLAGIVLFGVVMLALGVWWGAQPGQSSAPTSVCTSGR